VSDQATTAATAFADVRRLGPGYQRRVFVQRGESGWAVTTVASYHDTFRNADGTWVLARRSMEFIG
jgi:hypothetical protein